MIIFDFFFRLKLSSCPEELIPKEKSQIYLKMRKKVAINAKCAITFGTNFRHDEIIMPILEDRIFLNPFEIQFSVDFY